MKSVAENLLTSRSAADMALSLLERQGGLTAMAVWGRAGLVWQRLATRGAVDSLPSADALDGTRLPGPDAGAIALENEGETIGWLVWRGRPPDMLPQVASLLAGHLAAARLRAQRSAARITQESLFEISQLAGECSSLELFLPRLHRLLLRLLDASNFYIALVDEEADAVRFPYFSDRREPIPPRPDQLFPLADASLTAYLIRHKEPLQLTRDGLLELMADGVVVQGLLPASWLGVPLFNATGNVIGAAALQHYEDQAEFTTDDRHLFLFVARHIGFALDRVLYRSRLERQVWLRTCELEGANSRLNAEVGERRRVEKFQDVLFSIAQLSNASMSLEAFLGGLHRLLGELLTAPNCLVALYDMASDTISYPYCCDEREGRPQPHAPGKGLVEQVLHGGRPLLQRMTEGGCWLGVPLYSGHDMLGVLAVHSYDPEVRYSFRDQEVMEFVANNIGAAVARVRALEELQAAYAELEQRVRDRTSELDAVNAQLQFDSLHDPLTKLPNRAYFSKTLRRTWDSYVHGGGERFAVIFIDLDRFKLVNDTLGHLAGDHLLFEAGARIRSCLRHYDFMARLGGDEFAVLLFGTEETEGCELIARRIVSEFERPIILAGREVFTTASVGVVMADKAHYHKAEDLLRDADHAMYCTKQQGRHGYTLFNHELRVNQADQLALESELRRALEESGQLIPYYQPFVQAGTGELVGFETLVRWQHPTRGLISPMLFLPIAEESGLIMRLDRYMIHAACKQLRQWRDEGRVREDVSLHINLSSANFHDPDLVSWIAGLIERYQLPASMLHLEITESALIDVPEIAATVMHALHGLGVRLALDDFGTGYSALSYLHRYRFDVLKIDQSFVFDVDRKEESAAIVRAILALASALNLDVVAEGVETGAQMQRLREMGCNKLQGYFFSHPLPAEAIDWSLMARWPALFDPAAA